jgi:ABC-type branched-subunit amino acid transport system substrate-binding protein
MRFLPERLRSRRDVVLAITGLAIGILIVGIGMPLVFDEESDESRTEVAASDETGETDQAGSPGAEDIPGTDRGPSGGLTETTVLAGRGSGTASGATRGGAVSGAPTTALTAVPGSTVPARPSGLTATDRGVFPDRIKVGFLILDIATVGRLGVNVAIDPEQQQAAMQSYVDDINARGGIHGRKIDPVYRTYDVVSEDDQRAACLHVARDQKVFAVIIGFNLPNPLLCLVDEHQTPTFNNVSNNPDYVFARAQGRLIAAFARGSRMMAVWADEIDRRGMLAGKEIGIVTDLQTDPGGTAAKQLEQALKGRGHNVVRRSELSADLPTSASQVPVEVNQMQVAGVDIVFFVTGNTVRGTHFVQTAESQNYRPKYTVSDWSSNFTDSGSANMPQSFDGSLNITATRNSEFRAAHNHPEVALAQNCRRIYEARSGRKLAARGSNEYGLTMNICDMVRIFETAAKRAGANLTRVVLSTGVQALGAQPTASWGDGTFAPRKLDLNDHIRTNEWKFNCRCWVPIDKFHRGRF